MNRLSLHFVLAFFVWLSTSMSVHAAEYRILVVRTSDTAGTLQFLVDGKQQVVGPCWFEKENPIPAKTYTGCSATIMASKKYKGVFLPDDQTGRNGIFVHPGRGAASSAGCIVLAADQVGKIYDQITPKDGKNVVVEVRDVKDIKAQITKLTARLRKALEDPEELKKVVEEFRYLGPEGSEALHKELKSIVDSRLKAYALEFENNAKAMTQQKNQANRKEITQIRRFVMEQMHRLDDMRSEDVDGILQQTERLRSLTRVTVNDVRSCTVRMQSAFRCNQLIAAELDSYMNEMQMGPKTTKPVSTCGAMMVSMEESIIEQAAITSPGARALPKSPTSVESEELEIETVKYLNDFRISLGLNPLIIDGRLVGAARDHSKDMVKLNFFSHTSPVAGKRTPWDRAKLFDTSASAENIAKGQKTPAEVHRAWVESPGHRANLVGNASRIGVGVFEDSKGVKVWTQLFGK